MARRSPRQAFSEIATRPDAAIDLAEAALWIAAEESPWLDVHHCLERLDGLARDARERLRGTDGDDERVTRLNRYLFQEQGFRGNRERYYDPRNSFLDAVLERRTGIPITLALVYMEVGRRLGLPIHGIGFPGHFLVKYAGERDIVVDPFEGVVLSRAQCQERLDAVLGGGVALRPEVHLRAAAPREILVRLLGNLKQLYLRAGDPSRALACCDRILLLTPEAPFELRDRGLVHERLECFGAALADLERFLARAPDTPCAPAVRRRVEALRVRVRRLH